MLKINSTYSTQQKRSVIFLSRIGHTRENSTLLTGVNYYEFFNDNYSCFMYGNTIKTTIPKKTKKRKNFKEEKKITKKRKLQRKESNKRKEESTKKRKNKRKVCYNLCVVVSIGNKTWCSNPNRTKIKDNSLGSGLFFFTHFENLWYK